MTKKKENKYSSIQITKEFKKKLLQIKLTDGYKSIEELLKFLLNKIKGVK